MIAPIRTALIGCGAIAELGHLPALLEHPSFELVGLCDVRADRLNHLARMAPSARRAHDYRAMLDVADAFILALHPEVSVAVAMDLLSRGKHVLDEKPLAVSLADADRLRPVVGKSSAIYQVGFVFRYSEFATRVASMIQLLGAPASVSIRLYDERLDPCDPEHRARLDAVLRHSSAITHEGSHFIDMARLWNHSAFRNIHAIATRTIAALPGPNLWHAIMRHEDEGLLHLEIGWLLPENPPSMLNAVGPAGWLSAPLAGGEAELVLNGECRKISIPAMRQNWQGQLDLFARAIHTGTTQGATFDDGCHALATTLACESCAGVNGKDSMVATTGRAPASH